MVKIEDFLVSYPDEVIRIGWEKEGLVVRPLSRLGDSSRIIPHYSEEGNLEEAVRNFDERNEGFNLSDTVLSSDISRELLERVVGRNTHIGNKIIQGYGLFDVQMFGEIPIFRYTLGLMPEYVHSLERDDLEGRVGLHEFGGILHRGFSPNSLQEAYQQMPENYSNKLGFDWTPDE